MRYCMDISCSIPALTGNQAPAQPAIRADSGNNRPLARQSAENGTNRAMESPHSSGAGINLDPLPLTFVYIWDRPLTTLLLPQMPGARREARRLF